MPFIIDIDGRSFNMDDLTVGDALAIEEVTAESWLRIDPVQSGKHFKAVAVHFLSREMTADEARAKVDAIPLKDILNHIRWDEEGDLPLEYEDNLPKAEDDPLTDGSSGRGTTSDSHPASPENKPSAT